MKDHSTQGKKKRKKKQFNILKDLEIKLRKINRLKTIDIAPYRIVTKRTKKFHQESKILNYLESGGFIEGEHE
jgi:hypothetical protein